MLIHFSSGLVTQPTPKLPNPASSIMFKSMATLTKSSTLGTLGLPDGDHWVKFHVEQDTISFEIAGSGTPAAATNSKKQPTGFVEKWGGCAVKLEDPKDAWLTHINEKHLR